MVAITRSPASAHRPLAGPVRARWRPGRPGPCSVDRLSPSASPGSSARRPRRGRSSLAVAYLVAAPAPSRARPRAAARPRSTSSAAGETMWSIANDVAPAGEAATYVERLVEATARAARSPGQTLDLPVP